MMHLDPLGAHLRPSYKPYATSWAAPASMLGLGPAIINCPQYKRLPAQTFLVLMPPKPTSGAANNLGLVTDHYTKAKKLMQMAVPKRSCTPGGSHTLRLASEI